MKTNDGALLIGRKVDFFNHTSGAEYGYEKEQNDTFAVLHPRNETEGRIYPLYVVFHSAGHDVWTCLTCLQTEGNHDIYHVPDDMYGLFLDCRANMNDWWWGGINAVGDGDPARAGTGLQPVEKRCLDTIEHVLNTYPLDRNRVYGVGNSMGGSGVLGIALNHGDIFAAIKANVPAGVRHAADRCCLDTEKPTGFSIPEPPVVVDYSAQNDMWSGGHEILYKGMRDSKYALIGFWGAFGHENNNAKIALKNDLIAAYDFTSVKLNEAYPVFTDSSTDDPNPWEHPEVGDASGQVNGYYRWEVREDSAESFVIDIRILTNDEWNTRVTLPENSSAVVTLRRLQNFRPAEGEKIYYSCGNQSGEFEAQYPLTIPERLEFCGKFTSLTLKKR